MIVVILYSSSPSSSLESSILPFIALEMDVK